jgi:hypothetical protein
MGMELDKNLIIYRVLKDSPLVSRFVKINDSWLEQYDAGYDLDINNAQGAVALKGTLGWRFLDLKWWSRIYEYQWLQDCIKQWFTGDTAEKIVLDAGCGASHPGSLMLADNKFKRIDSTGQYDKLPLFDILKRPSVKYYRWDMLDPFPFQYDCVVCLATLEPQDTVQQLQVLHNLANAVKSEGILMIAAYYPLADPQHLVAELTGLGFEIITDDVDEAEKLTNTNGPVTVPEHGIFSLYRLFAHKLPE